MRAARVLLPAVTSMVRLMSSRSTSSRREPTGKVTCSTFSFDERRWGGRSSREMVRPLLILGARSRARIRRGVMTHRSRGRGR